MHPRPALLVVVLLSSVAVTGATRFDDRTAIVQTLLDYAEGFYGGEPSRMTRALSPALTKRQWIARPGAAPLIGEMNADTLIDASHGVKLAAAERRMTTDVFDVGTETASARVFSARFNDYVHLVKRDGAWQIVNVLWHAPPTAAAGDHTAAVTHTVRALAAALTGAGGTDVSSTLHPLAHIRVLMPGRQGRPRVLANQNADAFVTALSRGAGKLAGTADQVRVVVEGIDHDIASARIHSGGTVVYVHLARGAEEWRVVTTLTRTE